MKSNMGKLLLTLLASAISFVPFYITLNVAFKPMTDMTSRWIPAKELYLENFIIAKETANIFDAMKNSAIITICSVTIIVLFGAMAAYPLARIRDKFNRLVMNLIVGVMMVPPLSILVPLYSNLSKMGGISTFWGIIIINATFQLPLSIFIYSNFIMSIPTAIDEAARIDGCTEFQVFMKVILPLLKPVTATVIILTGVATWNDYRFSLFFLQDPKMRTVTLAISSFFSQSASNLNAAAAAALIAIIPVVIIYLLLQKYFIKGMVDSAIK